MPAGAQSLLGLGDMAGPTGATGGLGRPLSPFMTPLEPGRSAGPTFWQPNMLPDLGGPGQVAAGGQPPPWSIGGSVLGSISYTDNVQSTPTNTEGDVYFTLVPRVTAAADTARVVGAATYSPRLRYYVNNPSQNNFDQVFGAQGTATVVSDQVFVEFSASGDVQSVFGNFVGEGVPVDNTNNDVQTASYRVSPYVVHRFGNFATARVGYAFRQVVQDGNDAFEQGQTTPFFISSGYISNQFYGFLNSGPDFGRFGWTLAASSTDFDGDNVYDGAYNRVYGAQMRYAITNQIAGLVDLGWQDLFYNGTTPYTVNDPVWSVGVRYQPDATSFLTVRYGQYDGQTSWFANGGIDLGVRTRLFVNYSESLSNSALMTGNSLNSLRVDALGNLVDSGTGAPAAIAFSSPLQNVQSGIFLQKRGALAISHVLPRDTVSLALSWQESDPVAIAAGTQPFSQTSRGVTLGWTRALQPAMSLSAAGRFGTSESQNINGTATNYGFTAALTRTLSPRLFASLRYEYSNRETNQFAGRTDRNVITLSLRQAF